MTHLNVPLLRKAVEWAESEASKPKPEREWDQEGWMMTPAQRLRQYVLDVKFTESRALTHEEIAAFGSCGTSYCIAGYVCNVMGDEFVVEEERSMQYAVKDADGGTTPVEVRAAEHLGIQWGTYRTLSLLFDASNTIDDVKLHASNLAAQFDETL